MRRRNVRNKAALLQIVTTILGAVTVVLMVIAGAEAVSGNQFGTADAGLGRRLYLPAVSNEYLTRTATPGPQGVWTKKADLNMRRTALGAVTGSNGKLYAIGGYTYVLSPYGDRISTVVAKVEEYDHIANTWTEKADMPTARTDLGVATAGNGKIYAIGGSSRGFPDLRTVEEYDPATNVWTTKADMPTSRRSLGVATAGNGKIYAIGGWSVGGPIIHSKVEEYDPATNVWTKKADMPTWRQMLGLVAGSNGKLYAVGGSTNGPSFRTSRDLATVEEYDPATDSWTTKSSMPTARSQLGVATAGNGKLYAIGGSAGFYAIGGSVGSKVEEYDLATDSWSAKANMLTARSFLAVATGSNGKLYAIGGYIDGEPGSVIVEEFDPDRSPSTATPTITLTVPAVSTSTPQSGTPTLTRTPTPTSTSTATASANNTGTQTSTPNVTSTATATPTPTPTPTPTLTVPPA